jgi:hypothetical protein
MNVHRADHRFWVRFCRSSILLATVLLGLLGCGGGQYGYAHQYEPLDEERTYIDRAAELSYEEVRRTRLEEQPMVGWFGVVVEPPRTEEDGSVRVLLSLRAHQERHLCETSSSDTCRVTVSAREIGQFWAILPIRAEDREGQHRMWTGSLVKVYGSAVEVSEEPETVPVLRADWYRHWPVHYYVTTASAGSMRR